MNPSQNPSAMRSKAEITDTLLQLMKSYPYNDITVKQIILESKVARKTFYRNFFSKDDVLNAHIDSIMQQYIQSLKQLQSSDISNVLDIIFEFCIQNQELLFRLRDDNLMHLLLNKWNVFIPKVHNQVVSPNNVMFQGFSDEQINYIISFNVGAIWNVIMKWIENDMKDSQSLIKTTILRYLSGFNTNES